jgi:hypothetical protein
MAAVRKVLKRMAAAVAPVAPAPGQLALQISDPHDAQWTLLQVRMYKRLPKLCVCMCECRPTCLDQVTCIYCCKPRVRVTCVAPDMRG